MAAAPTHAPPAFTTAAPAPAAHEPPRAWLVSRRFDLTWFFGGALVSLAALAICLAAPAAVLVVLWVWILAFDAPHMMAAYTRTFADAAAWRDPVRRRRVLLAPLAGFAVGPLAVVLSALSGSEAPFQLFLGAASLFAYYHVVRQHWGFVALYRARGGERSPAGLAHDRWTLNLGSYLPYAYLLVSHPRARVLIGLGATHPRALWERALGYALIAAWTTTVVLFVARALARPRGQRNPVKTGYLLLTVLLYGAMYFAIARAEPIYRASTGPDTDFILLSVMASVFHCVQYVGLIWVHNKNGYGAPPLAASAAPSSTPAITAPSHGPARWLSRSLPRYLAVCLAFAPLYLLVACATGVYPGGTLLAGLHWGPIRLTHVGLSLWWGIALHHYLLDQRIWRIREDPALRRNLGLA